MDPLRPLRAWRARRRLVRVLRDEGWTVSASIFTGRAKLDEVVYSPEAHTLKAINGAEIEWKS